MKYQILLLVLSIYGHEAKICNHKSHQNFNGQNSYEPNSFSQNPYNQDSYAQNSYSPNSYDGQSFNGQNKIDNQEVVFINVDKSNFVPKFENGRHQFIPLYRHRQQWQRRWPQQSYNDHMWTAANENQVTPIVVKSLSYRPEPDANDYHVRVAHGHQMVNDAVVSDDTTTAPTPPGHHHHHHHKMFTMKCRLVKVHDEVHVMSEMPMVHNGYHYNVIDTTESPDRRPKEFTLRCRLVRKHHRHHVAGGHKYQTGHFPNSNQGVKLNYNQWSSPIDTRVLLPNGGHSFGVHANAVQPNYVHAHSYGHHAPRPKRQVETQEGAGSMGAGAGMQPGGGMGAGAGMGTPGAGMGAGAGMVPGGGMNAGAGMGAGMPGGQMPGMPGAPGAPPPDYSKMRQQWEQGMKQMQTKFKQAQTVMKSAWGKIRNIFGTKDTPGGANANPMGGMGAGASNNEAQSMPPV